jgi:hypothetical protein
MALVSYESNSFQNGKKIKPEGTTGPDFVVTHRLKQVFALFILLILSVCGEATCG